MPGRYRRFLIGESVGFVLYAAGRFDNSLGVFKAIWPLMVAFICLVRAIAVGRTQQKLRRGMASWVGWNFIIYVDLPHTTHYRLP